MKKGTSPSALSDSFCRIPSANAVSADASAAMNSHVLFRVPTKQCPGICTGRCTPHSTFLIERTKKHIILPFPPAFICFRKTWIPHFRRCSRMRMQCFTRRNRNEIRMLRKFYQNRIVLQDCCGYCGCDWWDFPDRYILQKYCEYCGSLWFIK